MGHQGKWELASPCSYHKRFPSICSLVWNPQPQPFRPLMLLPDEICWTCFPSQPSFPFYPRVECFSGSLALLSGFHADPIPSLAWLYPSLLPLAAFRARVSWREVLLPSQPPFVVSIRRNMEELFIFQLVPVSP